MKEYRLTPFQWSYLSRIDKKILIYSRIMEVYYLEFSPERVEMRKQAKEAKHKRKMDGLMNRMPALQKSRRYR